MSVNYEMAVANVNGVSEKVINPITHETVLTVTFLRENGLFTVRCTSSTFQKYFKNQSSTGEYGNDGDKWNRSLRRNPVTQFMFHRSGLTSNEVQALRNWGQNSNQTLMQSEQGEFDVPNISWIVAKELDVGIKVILCNTPIDDAKFKLYCDQSMKYLSSMYNKYMTRKQSKGKITTKLEHLQ